MMRSTDLDVIKDIPGYKVILKAIVRSQIQQLVEQLAVHTDEESVILTASVSDGTLSHLGSLSGKSFLQDNEEVKSQFLGFCLKDHHRRKLEREKQAREKLEQELQQQLQQHQKQQELQQQMMFNTGPQFTRSPRQFSPRYQAPRHQPYPMNRPRRPPAPNLETGPQNNGTGQAGVVAGNAPRVKVEPSQNDGSSYQSGSELEGNETRFRSSDSVSDSGVNSEQVGMGSSDSSNHAPGDLANTEQTDLSGREGVDVKLESLEESELDDLEITGVEPGQSPYGGQDSWDPSGSMTFDPTGATGSSLDVSGSQAGGYMNRQIYKTCQLCGKDISSVHFKRHMMTHTGERPYVCTCGKTFARHDAMVRHERLACPYRKIENTSQSESSSFLNSYGTCISEKDLLYK